MADEQEAIAAPAVETPSVPVNEVVEAAEDTTLESPQDVQDEGTEEAEPTGEDAEEEVDELDFAFKKYNVPKSLKQAVEAMRADYTHKTQSAAETKKALDEREAAITQQAEATEEELTARASLLGIEKTLGEYSKLTQEDWNAIERDDPIGAQQHWRTYQMLQQQRNELSGTITAKQNERTEKAQQDLAKRVQETLEAAPKVIPGWKPEKATETINAIVEFAQSEGVSEKVLKDMWSPTLLALLNKARIGDMAIKQQSAPRAAPKLQVTPLTTVKATSNPASTRSLAQLASGDDVEAYVAARKAGRVR
jgi:hypothetical protein